MLEIKVKMLPSGNEDQKRTIGKIEIENTKDHSDWPIYGNYNVEVYTDFGVDRIRIENHYRDDGWIVLLKNILAELQ